MQPFTEIPLKCVKWCSRPSLLKRAVCKQDNRAVLQRRRHICLSKPRNSHDRKAELLLVRLAPCGPTAPSKSGIPFQQTRYSPKYNVHPPNLRGSAMPPGVSVHP